MKHDKLMKYPKRFCVDCGVDQYVTVKVHKGYRMYHCQECSGEICRSGDGAQARISGRVQGGIDISSLSTDRLGGQSSEILARENGDVLSDEHRLWRQPDPEDEFEHQMKLRLFRSALAGLTERQHQVVEALELYGTHEKVAAALGVKRITITTILKQIQKKLNKSVNNSGAATYKGRE